MYKIYILGIDGPESLQHHRRILERCILIVSSRRFTRMLGNTLVPIQPITPLAEAFEQIETTLTQGNVSVLASGDPLFYGIAGKLIEKFGNSQIEIQPALSSLQLACTRFKLPWNDARIISLHGRKASHLPALLLNGKKTLILTDNHFTPGKIASDLLLYLRLIEENELIEAITLHIAENLGTRTEKISTGSLTEAAAGHYSSLNVLCLELPAAATIRPTFGLRVDEIAHSRGLITKDEVRAITLHRLHLPQHGVFWDVGGGSGSISIEAAAMHPDLTVYTVEHRIEELANIRENIRRFHLYNIIPVCGRAKDVLADLPAPDCIFIGGSDGEMAAIISHSSKRLQQGGCIVVNAVTEKTASQTPKIMKDYNLVVESATVTITKETDGGKVTLNPITILTGRP